VTTADLQQRMRSAAELVERGLAPYAVRDEESKKRDFPQKPDWNRTAFQLDRDRILYSSSFRRLAFKTQVFICNRNNMHRTRLTHSLEVAQLSRAMAQILELNSELCEAIALAHDLGHAPFGHAGEATLRELMKDAGGFEHNEHSLRVVEFVEKRFVGHRGLNLTFATREGIIKHQTNYDRPQIGERYLARGTTLEAEVVSVADRISYYTHDIEDSFREGLLDLAEIEKQVPLWREIATEVRQKYNGLGRHEFFYRAKSGLIKRLLAAVLETTLQNLREQEITDFAKVIDGCRQEPLVAFSHAMAAELETLEKYLLERIYCSPLVVKMNDKAAFIIREVFSRYENNSAMIPRGFSESYPAGTAVKKIVCDYIAGMTDLFMLKEYRMLFDPEMDILIQ